MVEIVQSGSSLVSLSLKSVSKAPASFSFPKKLSTSLRRVPINHLQIFLPPWFTQHTETQLSPKLKKKKKKNYIPIYIYINATIKSFQFCTKKRKKDKYKVYFSFVRFLAILPVTIKRFCNNKFSTSSLIAFIVKQGMLIEREILTPFRGCELVSTLTVDRTWNTKPYLPGSRTSEGSKVEGQRRKGDAMDYFGEIKRGMGRGGRGGGTLIVTLGLIT